MQKIKRHHHQIIDTYEQTPPILKPLLDNKNVEPYVDASPPIDAFTPEMIRQAYNIPSTATGLGAKIAIVNLCPLSNYTQSKMLSDYNNFSTQFGLPTSGLSIHTYPPKNATIPTNTNGWGLEVCLDVQWAHAIAPQATIMLILVQNPAAQTLSGVAKAVEYAVSLGANIVSMSFGLNEVSNQLSLGFEPVFQNPNVTFIASAGNEGGILCYPACSQNVISVGGTSLGAPKNGEYIGESGWIQSGGGVSKYVPYPSFQSSANLFPIKPYGRCIPDVGFIGDPYTGVAVYCSEPPFNNVWTRVGGTSLGAPCWAGICALLYEKIGSLSLGTANLHKILYNIYKSPQQYAECFNDVIIGQSVAASKSNVIIKHNCKEGYDLITGIGTPNVEQLLNLTSLPPT
jgi:subtilase family serine protease